jgi:SagB-type dehydrogenase family enzyme
LPAPDLSSHHSLEACLLGRRSCREFSSLPLTLPQISQLLWAAQGVTGLGGLRTAPSAGALYPLHTYVAAANVEALPSGVYRYDPDGHLLSAIEEGDRRERLMLAVLGQQCAKEAAVAILFAAHYGLPRREFGDEAERLAQIEAGHAAQNLCLQATALGLGLIGLGKFDADMLRAALGVPDREVPLYILVVGRKLAV